MVKKISAIILALVLCFSVVVLPANAMGFDDGYTFAPGKTSAFKVELDKASYNKGDVVTVRVYLRLADPAAEIKSGYLTIGYNSAAFGSVNTNSLNAVTSSVWDYSWKEPNSSQWATVSGTILNRVLGAATEQEKALYDTYLRVALALDETKDFDNTHGVTGANINAESEPFLTFQLKVKDDVADGTPINVGFSEAALNCKPAQTSLTFLTNIGVTDKGKAAAAATYDVSAACATAVVGSAKAAPVLTKGRAQYKMETLVPGVSVADNFQYRVLSTISKADWEANFENTAVEGETTKALTEVGFIAADTATFDLNTAKTAVIANTTGDYTTGLPAGYKAATTNHIYRTDGDATFACRVDTSKDTCADLTYIAFAKYLDADGQPQVIFYDEAATVLLKSSYDELVNRWLGQ